MWYRCGIKEALKYAIFKQENVRYGPQVHLKSQISDYCRHRLWCYRAVCEVKWCIYVYSCCDYHFSSFWMCYNLRSEITHLRFQVPEGTKNWGPKGLYLVWFSGHMYTAENGEQSSIRERLCGTVKTLEKLLGLDVWIIPFQMETQYVA